MTYEELRDYAMQCSLEHHLCNVEELLDEGKTITDILAIIEAGAGDDPAILPHKYSDIVVWEPYEYHERSSLLEAIEDMRGVKVHEFMQVLTKVNGEEWATNYKEELDPVWCVNEDGNHTCVDCMDEVTPEEVLGDRTFGEPRCEGCYDTYKYGA